MSDSPRRHHILTVAVEDYFHASAFSRLITPDHALRLERRVRENTLQALDLLDEFNVKATFFALGSVADEMPELLAEIARRGHEVASKGYHHRALSQMSIGEFREDVRRSREAIERATGQRVYGYRIARGHFTARDLWALDVLAEEGYAYDSSFYPRGRAGLDAPWRRFEFVHQSSGGRSIHEFPMSSWQWQGWDLPIAGGAYLRHLPHRVTRRLVADRVNANPAPLVMYFHAWELDPDVPRITAAPGHTQVRQYRNLEKMRWRLRYYLKQYDFGGVRDWLGLPAQAVQPVPLPVHEPAAALPVAAAGDRQAVTLVVPCFNEEKVLPSLANTLRLLEQEFADRYVLSYVFVNDASTDDTWGTLQRVFGQHPRCKLVAHERNRGVAAAILTGIQHAGTELVCSIDCDCTYDPRQIGSLLPMLTEDVALVTASPYHPLGAVSNVPGWRLFLSKGCSFIYRRLFHLKLHTYTSCFRAYRRSRVQHLEVDEGGFLGVAEMLIRLDKAGERIVEQPAKLEVRLLGHSKMKVLRTIRGHLAMIGRLLYAGGASPAPEPPAARR